MARHNLSISLRTQQGGVIPDLRYTVTDCITWVATLGRALMLRMDTLQKFDSVAM